MSSESIIKLPAPTKESKLSLTDAICQRRSVRQYDGHALSLQEISNLCYYSAGITDTERGLTANPTACNSKEIILYVVRDSEVSEYLPESHSLRVIEMGDFRNETGSQPFVKDASVNFVYVRRGSRFSNFPLPADKFKYECTDAAIMATLTCVYAEGIGLHSVMRGLFDAGVVSKRLQLLDEDKPILTVSVG